MSLSLILWLILVVGFLDTMIGNRIFPGKTGVVSRKGNDIRYIYYNVYKKTRFFFIPIRMWLCYEYDTDRVILNFNLSYSQATNFHKDAAIQKAQIYANKKQAKDTFSKETHEEVWNSRLKQVDEKFDTLLLSQLSEAVREDDEEKIIEISRKLGKKK